MREVFGGEIPFRVSRVAPVPWLGGVLVDYETERGSLTMHDPARKILSVLRHVSADAVTEHLDNLSAAGRAVKWLYGLLPWSKELEPSFPEEFGEGHLRMTFTERLGDVEMPSNIHMEFLRDGEVTFLLSYHEPDAVVSEPVVTREQAISIAEQFADSRPDIFGGCRYRSVGLRVRLVDGAFRTGWFLEIPSAISHAYGGTIEVDAVTGELLGFDRYM